VLLHPDAKTVDHGSIVEAMNRYMQLSVHIVEVLNIKYARCLGVDAMAKELYEGNRQISTHCVTNNQGKTYTSRHK
jgi:hypothetical protein